VQVFAPITSIGHANAGWLWCISSSTRQKMPQTTKGGGTATPAPDAAAENDIGNEDYRRPWMNPPVCPILRLPLLVKFNVQNINFTK
jgi:hypothetical protein